MCQWGAKRNPLAGYRSLSPTSHNLLNRAVEKSSFEMSANQLEVVENVNRRHFRIHRLVVKWRNEQSKSFRQSPNLVKAQCVGSSINIVVMTLLNSNYVGDSISRNKVFKKNWVRKTDYAVGEFLLLDLIFDRLHQFNRRCCTVAGMLKHNRVIRSLVSLSVKLFWHSVLIGRVVEFTNYIVGHSGNWLRAIMTRGRMRSAHGFKSWMTLLYAQKCCGLKISARTQVGQPSRFVGGGRRRQSND